MRENVLPIPSLLVFEMVSFGKGVVFGAFYLTPEVASLRSSCILTLTVSKGWQRQASMMPAAPPAILENRKSASY